jgi:hypothetical protein
MPEDHVPWGHLGDRCHSLIQSEMRVAISFRLWSREASVSNENAREVGSRNIFVTIDEVGQLEI